MLWGTKPPRQLHKQLVHFYLLKFLSLGKFGKLKPSQIWEVILYLSFSSCLGSCNSKILLEKSWDSMDQILKIHDLLSSKSQERISITTFLFFYVFTKYYTRLFCINSFDVKTIKFNRFYNPKNFISYFFQTGLIETWNKKYFLSLKTGSHV